MRLTLDTNCIYAVENGEPSAGAVMALVEAHKAGRAEVAVLGMSGSERQRGGGSLRNIGDFFGRLKYLGFGDLPVLKPIGKYDVTYFDWCIYATPEHIALEDRIHAELFPNISPDLKTYYASLGLDENTATADDRANGSTLCATCKRSGLISTTSGVSSSRTIVTS